MARLTKDQLADRSRYKFREEEVDLPELGGSVAVKTLTVGERNALPDLTDENGKPNASVADLAKVFAAVVVDPKLSAQEAAEFLGDLPATAYDRVLDTFGKLLGTKEDADQKFREFPSASPSED